MGLLYTFIAPFAGVDSWGGMRVQKVLLAEWEN
jgi:hypothetical protein